MERRLRRFLSGYGQQVRQLLKPGLPSPFHNILFGRQHLAFGNKHTIMASSPSSVSLGQSALANAKWEEAKKQFERALLISDSPEARDGLGLALWWVNDISGAHELCSHDTLV